jgi:hypothetical protein
VELPPSLRSGNWRQGSILDADLIADELARLGADASCCHAVVVSQDCDVVADATIEPTVELIAAALVAQPDNGFLHGKNPRQLCLSLSAGQGHILLDVRRRFQIPKEAIAGASPRFDLILPRKEIRLLARWLGKRYTRDAFPDSFNERLRPAQKQLEKISKSAAGAHITTIFIMLHPEDDELYDTGEYRAVLWFACRPEVFESLDANVEANLFANDFCAALKSCDGIVVDEWEVRSHEDITLADLELMQRFDLDFRSEAPKPGGSKLTSPM